MKTIEFKGKNTLPAAKLTIVSMLGSGAIVKREYNWMCLRCFGVTASTPGHTKPWLGQWCGRGLPSSKCVALNVVLVLPLLLFVLFVPLTPCPSEGGSEPVPECGAHGQLSAG